MTPDSVYENIEVYICYEETDASGRRTKDSIIAQEVYQKLENAKITAFYERISAGAVAGQNLIAARSAAIAQAKAVVVLGTSVQSFRTIEEKYGPQLKDKTVIPFCVDVNPGAIPKSLSKVQAVSYTTIGWDKDLIKGLYNLLGKEEAVDTGALYGKQKKKTILICAIVALVAVAATLVVLLGGFGKEAKGPTKPKKQAVKPLTPQEIYDQAVTLMDEGRLTESLDLLLQIPDHPDSGNRIKLLYAKFEGYYKTNDVNLHLDVVDNGQAEVDVTMPSQNGTTSFSTTATIEKDTISASYRDRSDQTGTMELKLEDSGVRLFYTVDGVDGTNEVFFTLTERSDEPLVKLDRTTLLGWLNSGLSFDEIRAQGYDLVEVDRHYLAYITIYHIPDTEIYLTISATGRINNTDGLIAIQAPASILAPNVIGQGVEPYFEGDLFYWPDRVLFPNDTYVQFRRTNLSTGGSTITEDMPIGVTAKRFYEDNAYNFGWYWIEKIPNPDNSIDLD